MTTTKKQLVRLTNNGKIRIALEGNLKSIFAVMIEKLMRELEPLSNQSLDMSTVEYKKDYSLISEIYFQHFVQFNLVNSYPIKISLTLSQAFCLWQMSSEYDHVFYSDPQMGNLLMQLHQKLS